MKARIISAPSCVRCRRSYFREGETVGECRKGPPEWEWNTGTYTPVFQMVSDSDCCLMLEITDEAH